MSASVCPVSGSVCPICGGSARRRCGPRRPLPTQPPIAALIGDLATAPGRYLTAFVRAEHAGALTMPDVGETDFAVVVYREEDQWEAGALPAAVTADLDGFVRALRRQPSIGGTIGFAGVGDDFWVAVRVLGEDVLLFLSDLTAAVEVGFEPTEGLPPHTLSRRAPSATRRLHRWRAYLNQPALGGSCDPPRCLRAAKNSCSTAPHSAASTPPMTSGRWFRRRSLSTSHNEPAAPALGSSAP